MYRKRIESRNLASISIISFSYKCFVQNLFYHYEQVFWWELLDLVLRLDTLKICSFVCLSRRTFLAVFKVNSSTYNSWEMRYLLIFCGSPLATSCHYSNSSHKKHRGNNFTSKKDSASFVTGNCAYCFIPSGGGRFL